MRILTDQQEALLNEERKLLNDLQLTLVQFGASEDDQKTIRESIQQLDELFLLVVVGEFNAGKSAFINAFLGQKALKEGVTPTTSQINILHYGPQHDSRLVADNQMELLLPIEWLDEISIVDTPGTNAIIRTHEAITTEFVPRSDLVLFITSADRPFTESERAFLERIRDWGKKVVIVINKIDLFESEQELDQVRSFVSDNARLLLGTTPEVFPVSARTALRAKMGEPELWEKSRFGPLEQYIHDTLDETGRLRLKLLNPLGVGSHLVEKYAGITRSRLDLLRADFTMLEDVDAQLGVYREDMQRDFRFRMSDIENLLYELEQRGQDYFDETFRLARVLDLLSKDRIQREFEQKVVGDVPDRIERKIHELIDWLVDSDLRQWQAVNEHLAERRRAHQERIVGESSPGSFHYDRERLMDAVHREAMRVIESYDKEEEARSIAEGAQQAVAASAAIEAGAVGLGTLITLLASTAAADVTGILAASVVAALGLFVIPVKRRQAKNELKEKIAALRDRLVHSLTTHFEREIDRSLHQINEAIAPYTRFVRAERDKLQDMQTTLEEAEGNINRLRARLENL